MENEFVKEGYLIGIPFIGMSSTALKPLLQVSILEFHNSSALRQSHWRCSDSVHPLSIQFWRV